LKELIEKKKQKVSLTQEPKGGIFNSRVSDKSNAD
jgi:hypothetical protein